MPEQPPKIESIAFGEMTPDTSDFAKDGTQAALNLLYVDGTWRELRGREVHKSMHIGNFGGISGCWSDPVGLIYFSTNQSRLWVYDCALRTFTDVSKGGAAYATFTNWHFTKYGPTVIATPSVPTIPVQARINGAGSFVDLVTSTDRPVPKFVGVTRSFLLGANIQGGAGVYATANPQQFAWCALGDAATWTPGVNLAGFAPLVSEDGRDIHGMSCFEDYFLLFKDYEVVRFDASGGPEVWQPSEVAAGLFGINNPAWSDSIVRCGRDTYYWSNGGPAVIIDGQSPFILGENKFRRSLTDSVRPYAADTGFIISGSFNADLGMVVWAVQPRLSNNDNKKFLVCYKIGAGRTAYSEIANGKLSLIDIGTPIGFVAHHRDGVSSWPLDRLRMVEFALSTGDVSVTAFTEINTSLVGTLQGGIWQAAPGARFYVCGVRPVVRFDRDIADVPPSLTAPPILEVDVECGNRPDTFPASTRTVSMATTDDNGFIITPALDSVEGGYFRFTLRFPSMSTAVSVHNVDGLEILLAEAGRF